jgi:hypothetical protein
MLWFEWGIYRLGPKPLNFVLSIGMNKLIKNQLDFILYPYGGYIDKARQPTPIYLYYL